MTYEALLNIIDSEGILLYEMKFRGNSNGLYSDNCIAIDSLISTRSERKCVLSEEVGHHFNSYGNILDTNEVQAIKQEKRGRNWAYEFNIPLKSFIDAYKEGVRNQYELAEFLEVTEEFLIKAIDYYWNKYGSHYRVDNYIICFSPLYVEKMVS